MPNWQSEPAGEELNFGSFRLIVKERQLLRGDRPVRIGQRALDLLIILIGRPGETVGQHELMARTWLGSHVDDSNLRMQIAAVRKALRDGVDGARYILNVPGRGYRFVAAVTRGQSPQAGAVAVAGREQRASLPVRLTSVIGRDDGIATIADSVRSHRLVTITGPGGIGKTTVAISVIETLAETFNHQIGFVDLGQLVDAALVADSVAAALGVQAGPAGPVAAILEFLRDRHTLIVLDCCEPVIEAAAPLAETILTAARGLHILATSREPLRARGEWIFRLPGLDIPPRGGELSAAAVLTFPAVQLFVERATAARDGFVVADDDASLVVEICRRLDGIPLAIELAATLVPHLGLRELAERLDERLSLHIQGRRTAIPRHQTLRATLDWSYQLLEPFEQALLCRFGIFRGIFTRDAARAVAASGADLSDVELAQCIGTLLDKSFLVADFVGPVPAYRCLDVPRVYLLEKLEASGAAQEVARLHAQYFTSLFEQAESGWELLEPNEVRRTLGRHIDNVRAALEWAFGSGRTPELGIALTVAAVPLWIALFLLEECRRLVERALAALAEKPGGNPRQEMRLYAMLGVLTQHVDGVGPGLNYPWGKVLVLAEGLGDLDYELRALRGLTNGTMTQNYRDALRFAQRYRIAAGASTDPSKVLVGDRMIGFVLHHLGEHDEARRLTEGMLARFAPPPDRSRLVEGAPDPHAIAKVVLARILWLQGFPDRAMCIANDAAEETSALDHPVSLFSVIAYATCPIALLEGDLGRAAAAREMLRTVVKQHRPFEPWSDGFTALDLIQHGEAAAGLAILNEATQAMHDNAFGAFFGMFIAGRVEGLSRCGLPADALRTADAALAHCHKLNEYWYVPELMRLRGEALLLRAHSTSAGEAESEFQTALDLARTQTALSWELRIATSLTRLLHRQGRDEAAYETLAPILGRFSEGFDTADVIAAQIQLRDLNRRP